MSLRTDPLTGKTSVGNKPACIQEECKVASMETYLQTMSYWPRLSGEEKELLCASSTLRTFRQGEHIVQPGMGECMGMLLLLQGEIRAYLLSEEGRTITLFRLYGGESCVFSAACFIRQITFDTFLTAEKECRVLLTNADAFARLAERNVHVRCYMYELIAHRFSAVMWSMQQILFLGYDRRLATFLLNERERLGTDELLLTHEQIAQYTSSAREVVARMLKRFSQEGLVTVRRGRIRLTDPEGLRLLI